MNLPQILPPPKKKQPKNNKPTSPYKQFKHSHTVSGQNKIGRELTLLALIQPTVIKQQAVNNNWL